MKYKVTKQQIIDAVLTEPLTFGKYIDFDRMNDSTCQVCAVGAVLRKVGFSNNDIYNKSYDVTNGIATTDQLDLADKNNNFLQILSTHHEYFATTENSKWEDHFDEKILDDDLQRLHLLNVIEAFCPDFVEFEVK
jgi:hypothetical protein